MTRLPRRYTVLKMSMTTTHDAAPANIFLPSRRQHILYARRMILFLPIKLFRRPVSWPIASRLKSRIMVAMSASCKEVNHVDGLTSM